MSKQISLKYFTCIICRSISQQFGCSQFSKGLLISLQSNEINKHFKDINHTKIKNLKIEKYNCM